MKEHRIEGIPPFFYPDPHSWGCLYLSRRTLLQDNWLINIWFMLYNNNKTWWIFPVDAC